MSLAEVRVSPTKACGKGSKRKQDELEGEDEEGEDEERLTWVEAINQEYPDEDVGSEEDRSHFPHSSSTTLTFWSLVQSTVGFFSSSFLSSLSVSYVFISLNLLAVQT